MKKKYFRRPLLLMFFIAFTITGFSQNKATFWSQSSSQKINNQDVIFPKESPEKATFLNLDFEALKTALSNAPKRESISQQSNIIISFPNAEGVLESFRVQEASVMTPELQSQFPEIRSFVGQGIDNPAAIVRFSLSPEKGLSSMVLSNNKTVFIEPYSADLRTYISFVNSESDNRKDDFTCETEFIEREYDISDAEFQALRNANDGQLRTYRLALACTVEYAQFHGGTVNGVIAAMNASMTRVNGVYERDMALTMVMVPNTSIIFLGPDVNSDPYTNNNGGAMLGQNQTACDANIGFANYDIGHVFSTGGGGVAYLNSPCTSIKAGGVTGSGAPVGDTFDIDYVAHEMGHQYGGNHTQNNSCNRSAVSVEPGSASTIMGYAGICAPNVQNNSDAYFNGDNLKEMWLNISAGNSSSCHTSTTTGNTAPTANAGLDYSIPKSTAFVLKGSATDNNAAALTYCWEQSDETPATMPPVSSSTAGPAFRSLTPSISPDRYMPAFSTVLSGSLASTWEVVPSVSRTMDFLLTVRDNDVAGGNTASDNVIITVVDVTPFTVSTPPTWGQNSTQTVNWAVGQSNVAPINCQTVNILFAANGTDFDTTLAAGVPNTGSAAITVPNIANSTTAKILVEAADNIFYAVSNTFSINASPDFSISNASGDQAACNIDAVEYMFNYVTSNGFSENTNFTATGVPAGANVSFSPTSLNSDGTFNMTVDNLLAVANGNYTISVTGTASFTRTATVNLTITDGVCASIANTTFETSTTGVIINNGTTDILSNLNTGKPSGYSDYTAIVTDVNRESVYSMTVNTNTDGAYTCTTRVWIDWNQNCSFNDPGEEYNLGNSFDVTNGPTVNSPLSITIPNGAVLGNTTMRVTTKYLNDGVPTSCENAHDAEVEDYTINVQGSLSISEFSLSDLSIFPNPNQGEFTVKFNSASSEQIAIQVFDVRGRSIFNKAYQNTGDFNQMISLNNTQAGMYLLKINDGSKIINKKIIIK
tara:strand:+ start:19621 stop:22593 length:2973 start_codon:yes stop_codon:yes gene_type:complete